MNIVRIRQSMMDKRAILFGSLLPTFNDASNLAGNAAALMSVYLIASSLITGTAVGWVGAKLSSPGKQDKDTIRKGFVNERLNADIGYVRERLKHEEAQRQKQLGGDPVKSMRVFG